MIGIGGVLESLLVNFGYLALFGIVFAESGLFFGFFFPGDSLLFVAGFLAAKGVFDLYLVLAGIALSAILGDQAGYWTGSKFGRRLFNKQGSFFFDPRHVKEAEEFYKKHGKKTIILARFVPAVRTFAPIVAGIAHMDYRTFVAYNIAGGILWTIVFVLAGYFLGQIFPDAGEIITLVVFGIVVVSVAPIAFKVLKKRFKKTKN